MKIEKKYLERYIKQLEEIAPKLREIANMMKPEVSFDEQERLLAKLKQKNVSISGEIEEIIPFETWFNPNCATVVTEDKDASLEYPHHIWLVVYEPKKENEISDTIASIKVPTRSNIFWGAKKGAKELRERLKYSQNPILEVFPWTSNSYVSFNEIIREPYVRFYNNLPWNSSNWDNYLNSFSVIRVKKRHKVAKFAEFYHVGVYLGNNEVCHIYDYGEEKWMEARTTHIDTFLGDTSTTERCGGVDAYRPIIPFGKNIPQRIAWAKENNFRKGEYDLFNRNCGHFSHMIVFWINYCDQVTNKSELERFLVNWKNQSLNWKALIKPWWWFLIVDTIKAADKPVNNGKGSTINLINEISEVDGKISKLYNKRAEDLEAYFQIPPKDNCVIM